MTPPDDDQLDVLAAEYVLGTMRGRRSERFEARIREDPVLAARVRAWEARLAPLADGYAAADSSETAWAGIEQRLFAADGLAGGGAKAGSARWRRLAFTFAAAATVFLASTLYLAVGVDPPHCYAVLTDDAARPVAVVFDRRNMQELVVLPVGSRLAAGSGNARLWIVVGNDAVTVGTLHADRETRLPLDKLMLTAVMGSNARMILTRDPVDAPSTPTPAGARIAQGVVALL
jgi:anti-sigma-K factor RskA